MSNVRTFVVRTKPVAVEHPVGGKWLIKKLSPKQFVELEDLANEREYVKDPDGKDWIRDGRGFPISRGKGNSAALLEYIATEVVAGIDGIDFQDEEGNSIECTSAIITELLIETFDQVNPDYGKVLDEKKEIVDTRKTVSNMTLFWLMTEVRKLNKATQREQEAETKN